MGCTVSLRRSWSGRAIAIAVILVAGLTAPVRAELRRDGFWVSGGSGWIDSKVDCKECEHASFQRTDGLRLAFGGTPSQNVRLGLELIGFYRDENGGSTREGLALVATRWNPSSRSGFHFRVGYGLAHGRQGFEIGDEKILTTNTGISWLLGTGWDLPAGPFYITPSASMVVGAYGTIETGEEVLEDALTTSYWIGIDVTIP